MRACVLYICVCACLRVCVCVCVFVCVCVHVCVCECVLLVRASCNLSQLRENQLNLSNFENYMQFNAS